MKLPFRITPGRLLNWGVLLAIIAVLIAKPDPQDFARTHGAKHRLAIATGGTCGVSYPCGGGIARLITEHVAGLEATAGVPKAASQASSVLEG